MYRSGETIRLGGKAVTYFGDDSHGTYVCLFRRQGILHWFNFHSPKIALATCDRHCFELLGHLDQDKLVVFSAWGTSKGKRVLRTCTAVDASFLADHGLQLVSE